MNGCLHCSQAMLTQDVLDGLNKTRVMVSCISDEYVTSQFCQVEFRYAHLTLKLPIIAAVVGKGISWPSTEARSSQSIIINYLSIGSILYNFSPHSLCSDWSALGALSAHQFPDWAGRLASHTRQNAPGAGQKAEGQGGEDALALSYACRSRGQCFQGFLCKHLVRIHWDLNRRTGHCLEYSYSPVYEIVWILRVRRSSSNWLSASSTGSSARTWTRWPRSSPTRTSSCSTSPTRSPVPRRPPRCPLQRPAARTSRRRRSCSTRSRGSRSASKFSASSTECVTLLFINCKLTLRNSSDQLIILIDS